MEKIKQDEEQVNQQPEPSVTVRHAEITNVSAAINDTEMERNGETLCSYIKTNQLGSVVTSY
jgi:hypothetical protein